MLIREAIEEDYKVVFEWRNDPLSREMFFESTPIAIDAHRSWFFDALQNKMLKLYIGEINQMPVGIVRFDLKKKNKEAEVSINVSPSMRGKGLGKELLISSIDNIEIVLDVKLFARVKIKNMASVNIFQSAGFLAYNKDCLLYTSPSPRDATLSRMPSSA